MKRPVYNFVLLCLLAGCWAPRADETVVYSTRTDALEAAILRADAKLQKANTNTFLPFPDLMILDFFKKHDLPFYQKTIFPHLEYMPSCEFVCLWGQTGDVRKGALALAGNRLLLVYARQWQLNDVDPTDYALYEIKLSAAEVAQLQSRIANLRKVKRKCDPYLVGLGSPLMCCLFNTDTNAFHAEFLHYSPDSKFCSFSKEAAYLFDVCRTLFDRDLPDETRPYFLGGTSHYIK